MLCGNFIAMMPTAKWKLANTTYAPGNVTVNYDREGRPVTTYFDTNDRPYVVYTVDDATNPSALKYGDTRVIMYDSGGNRIWDIYIDKDTGFWKSGKLKEYDSAENGDMM